MQTTKILRMTKTVMRVHVFDCDLTRLLELNQYLDHEDIAAGAAYFDDENVKDDSMHSDIEDQLMKQGVLSGDKLFFVNEEDDCKGISNATDRSENRTSSC